MDADSFLSPEGQIKVWRGLSRGAGGGSETTCVFTDLDALYHALVAWPQQTQPSVLPHLALAVVVVDAHRDAQAAGLGAGAPGGALHQAVLLPG